MALATGISLRALVFSLRPLRELYLHSALVSSFVSSRLSREGDGRGSAV